MSGKYIAGVAIAVATTLGNAFGLTQQKLAHRQVAEIREDYMKRGLTPPPIKSYKQKRWWFGFLFMATASVTSLAVFALVGQSVSSSFAGMTIIWNTIFARMILHEIIRWTDIVVAIMMIIGCILTAVGGNSDTGFLTVDELVELLHRPTAYIGFGVFGTLTALSMLYVFAVDARFKGKGLEQQRRFKATRLFRSTLFARTLASGLFSAWVGFFAKGSVSPLIAAFVDGKTSSLSRWELYIFLFLLPVALAFQVLYLNLTLKYFAAVEGVPLYQALIVVCGVGFGWTLYDEASGKESWALTMFICGILLIIGGIGILFVTKKQAAAQIKQEGPPLTSFINEYTKATGMRRAHSDPPSRRPKRSYTEEADAPGKIGGIDKLRINIPVYRSTTEIKEVFLLKDATTPASEIGSPTSSSSSASTSERASPDAMGRAAKIPDFNQGIFVLLPDVPRPRRSRSDPGRAGKKKSSLLIARLAERVCDNGEPGMVVDDSTIHGRSASIAGFDFAAFPFLIVLPMQITGYETIGQQVVPTDIFDDDLSMNGQRTVVDRFPMLPEAVSYNSMDGGVPAQHNEKDILLTTLLLEMDSIQRRMTTKTGIRRRRWHEGEVQRSQSMGTLDVAHHLKDIEPTRRRQCQAALQLPNTASLHHFRLQSSYPSFVKVDNGTHSSLSVLPPATMHVLGFGRHPRPALHTIPIVEVELMHLRSRTEPDPSCAQRFHVRPSSSVTTVRTLLSDPRISGPKGSSPGGDNESFQKGELRNNEQSLSSFQVLSQQASGHHVSGIIIPLNAVKCFDFDPPIVRAIFRGAPTSLDPDATKAEECTTAAQKSHRPPGA